MNYLQMIVLKKLDYMAAVIKENLRLYGPVTSMGRLVSKDTELEGWFLPEGTAINAVMASVQENNENYEDAKQFKPERWLNNNSNNGAFLAFGGGSRVCVGNNFSILEQKVFLTLLLQKNEMGIQK